MVALLDDCCQVALGDRQLVRGLRAVTLALDEGFLAARDDPLGTAADQLAET